MATARPSRKQPNGTGERPRHNKARGRWEARYEAPGKDGKRVRKLITGSTAEDVRTRVALAIKALDAGLATPDDRKSVATFARYWQAKVLPGEGLAPRTVKWYGDTLETYVLPYVGNKTLTGRRALTVADVERMTAELGEKGLSHRVQVSARVTLGKVLRAAERDGLVARNVARLAKPPRDAGRARVIKAFTVDELERLLEMLASPPESMSERRRAYLPRWHPVAVVGVTTGLRPAELLALHWGDVHLEGQQPHLSVRHAISHVDGATLKAPKRPRSYRTVPLAPEAVTALKAWRRTQATERLAAGPLWQPQWPDLIFTAADGRAQRVDSFRHAMASVVTGAHPHRLRHTYATHLLEAGVPLAHVAELLGDTAAVVETTYSHVLRRKHEVTSIVSTMLR